MREGCLRMGKRSSFERVPRDFYPTPESAVLPLLPHLNPGTVFCEPCAGDGALIDHLTAAGHVCGIAADIDPRRDDIDRHDALRSFWFDIDCIITNPPWSREVLHPMIEHFAAQSPSWLLFDADWIHTRQSAPFIPLLRKIVSVGRVKWRPDSPFTGKDNCAWHLFDARSESPCQFIGRAA
jgi:hypothetical protein